MNFNKMVKSYELKTATNHRMEPTQSLSRSESTLKAIYTVARLIRSVGQTRGAMGEVLGGASVRGD